jgi:hypothetical protein
MGRGCRDRDSRCTLARVRSVCQLDLNTVDTVDAVKEENQDEDEGNLEAVLYFGYDRVLGKETGGSILANNDLGAREISLYIMVWIDPRALGKYDVRKHLAFYGERHGDDEQHEERHLRYKEQEHLVVQCQ